LGIKSLVQKSGFFQKKFVPLHRFFALMKKIIIINGPNLNLVGKRESNLYGEKGMGEYIEELKRRFLAENVCVEYRQSNVEGELVTMIQEAEGADGVVLNAGGYTHTSVAIPDAVAAIATPVVEVHITNILAREPERHVSLLSKAVKGSILGFGLYGYEMAIRALLEKY